MSKGKIALGAVIGAVAGVIAGLLTAPKPGKETRAGLKKKAEELKNQTAQRVHNSKDK
ncbi:MAG TPA: YtxH domain-containing protein [Candidatus Saccharimonadales bacterium]|nr:YtxH domain-containing protein [Candidatus Saccharimonadales bacterium]